jgi:alpha-L-fucosidase
MPDGRIEDRQADRLREMGAWLEKYGASIYATRGGPVQPQEWGVSTLGENRIYLHVLEPAKEIILAGITGEITSIRSMNDGGNIGYAIDGKDIKITLPKIKKNVVDYVIEINMK